MPESLRLKEEVMAPTDLRNVNKVAKSRKFSESYYFNPKSKPNACAWVRPNIAAYSQAVISHDFS